MAALWGSQGANKCNDSRCVTKSRLVRCFSRRYCCALCCWDKPRKLFKVSWLMQIMALEVLKQILLTSLTLRLSQGFVTRLKVWFLIARFVSFTCLFALSLLLYFIVVKRFLLNCIFFTLERESLSDVKSQFSQRCRFVLFDLHKSCTCLRRYTMSYPRTSNTRSNTVTHSHIQ
jgi:hypothetical protein